MNTNFPVYQRGDSVYTRIGGKEVEIPQLTDPQTGVEAGAQLDIDELLHDLLARMHDREEVRMSAARFWRAIIR